MWSWVCNFQELIIWNDKTMQFYWNEKYCHLKRMYSSEKSAKKFIIWATNKENINHLNHCFDNQDNWLLTDTQVLG